MRNNNNKPSNTDKKANGFNYLFSIVLMIILLFTAIGNNIKVQAKTMELIMVSHTSNMGIDINNMESWKNDFMCEVEEIENQIAAIKKGL